MTFEETQKKAKEEWEALQNSPRPRILVGAVTCGRAAGAEAILEAIREALARHQIEAIVTEVGCIGLCYLEPMIDIIKPGRPRITYGSVDPRIAAQLIEDYLVNDNPRPDLALAVFAEEPYQGIPRLQDLPMMKPQGVRIILRRCGTIDPTNINHYIATGGYSGLVRALSMKPEEVIAEVKRSGLRGRGGAGFPTGQKWEFCRASPGKEKYIICNADEGDPGAFMNRSVMEGDPHALLEGMLIGAYAIGATEGYIYCRAEYPLALQQLRRAMKQMEDYGLLGDSILGSGFSFRLHIKEGAGAFVCGEETALMASIEGKRGMPRARPPFPAQSGVWGKPSNINNVETWVSVAAIFQNSAEWFAQYGTEKSKGTKTFALTGKVERTGLVEIPLGMTLRQVIFDVGGGIVRNKAFKAVQTGGPSGGCLPASQLDLPIDYDSLAAAGSIMGSGGMVVADEDTCVVDFVKYFLSFTQKESCGKCPPCRLGTHHMLQILERITQGRGEPEDIDRLLKLCDTCRFGSLCALGGTAPNPVLTTIRYFREEYEAHIQERRCPAKACKALMSYYVVPEKCQGCLICKRQCPVDCIAGDKRLIHIIDQSRCIKCSTCYEVCPFDAIGRASGEEFRVPEKPVPIIAERPTKVAAR